MLHINHPSVQTSALPVHMSNLFVFDHLDWSFCAEASDLGQGLSHVGQVFNDAVDEGFIIQSVVTGKRVVFVLDETKRDADGDVTHWVYRPLRGQGVVGEEQLRVVVFND